MNKILLWLSNYVIRLRSKPQVEKVEPPKCPMCSTGTMRWCSCSSYCSDYACDKCGLGPEDWK